MQKPRALKKGDKILVIAPSSSPEFPAMRLPEGVARLKKYGFEVELGDTVRKSIGHWYFSAADEVRAKELNDAFSRDDVDGIFCARGGVGALRILDMLDYETIKENPKVFVGYSDITALQVPILDRAGLVTFHGPMVAPLPHIAEGGEKQAILKYNFRLLLKMIADGEAIELRNPIDAPAPKTIVEGKAKGVLTGGNVIIFTLMVGTSYDPVVKDRILFLENIAQDPWLIDDQMQSLALAGKLRDATGLVFGEFPPPEQYTFPTPGIEEIISTTVRKHGGRPSFLNLSCCHGRYCLPLPIGGSVELDADEGTVRLLEPAVEK